MKQILVLSCPGPRRIHTRALVSREPVLCGDLLYAPEAALIRVLGDPHTGLHSPERRRCGETRMGAAFVFVLTAADAANLPEARTYTIALLRLP